MTLPKIETSKQLSFFIYYFRFVLILINQVIIISTTCIYCPTMKISNSLYFRWVNMEISHSIILLVIINAFLQIKKKNCN